MRRALAVTLAVGVAAAGCGLQLRRDERLRFLSPPAGARVLPPVVVDWRIDARAFRPARFDGSRDPRRGVFAVFVDRGPMRPGRDIDSLAARDRLCSAAPGCPDRAWLADHGVYLTTRPAIALSALPIRGGRRAGHWRRHHVTIVLLDGRGVRIGETAWTRSFYAPDRAHR